MKNTTPLRSWRRELAARNVRSVLERESSKRNDRLCGHGAAYCNALIAGGSLGPRCPWCDRVETAMQLWREGK